MFKILILQAWYALSDEALEKQIARDLMFRRFIEPRETIMLFCSIMMIDLF
jgi:IS5 family transposase